MSVHHVDTGSTAAGRNSPHDIRSQDLGEHRARETRGTCYPLDTDEVQRMVLRAVREATPVYPLSTGRNWGMGSRNPVIDGCTILDLSRMNTIRTLDLDRGYAVVEPGVTQRQLVELLDGTPWMLNVTSGCADASIVGNTIERGDGTIRPRVEDLLGLEVVLGTGEIMTTGGLDRNGGWSGTAAGPDLTRAFLQSNLGVVTAMAIGFVPRPEAVTLVNATYANAALAEAVDAVIRVGRARVATHGMLRLKELFVVPEAGRAALADTADPDIFTVQVPLLGSREAVRLAENDIRATLVGVDGLMSYRSLDAATTPIDDPLYPRTLFARGIPSCLHLHQSLGVDECAGADEARIGWLTFLPVVPLQQNALSKAVELFGFEAERHGVAGMLEFNVISQHTTNMVTQIPFVRKPEAIERAHALRRAVRRVFLEAGFPPYRSNIDQMPRELADRSASYRDGPLDGLKRLFDPADIISPGRYLVVNR
ncbi:FAD-binding oxidoreductase [Nocardia anaemiae]|uniref:FAD-binding oxidoreductase n=1 Tax=Nocardia anaemiae TaxID=263910 RepID=UPI0009FCD185|nr:FAD-binding oxidoreductase [Nocardia anaemiae]